MTLFRTLLLPALMIAVFASTTVTRVSAEASKEKKQTVSKAEKKITKALAELSDEDRKLAVAQRFCVVNPYSRLGSMGAPVKAMVSGKPVFVCCKGCVDKAVKGGGTTLRTAKKLATVNATLAKLPAEERAAAEAQKYCAVANTSFLGSMGAPIKLELDGKPVYLCCEGCSGKAKADPAATLAKVESLKKGK